VNGSICILRATFPSLYMYCLAKDGAEHMRCSIL
jgi:hypothetical protein